MAPKSNTQNRLVQKSNNFIMFLAPICDVSMLSLISKQCLKEEPVL